MTNKKPLKIKWIVIGAAIFLLLIAISASSGTKTETSTGGPTTTVSSDNNEKKELVKRINKWFIEDYLKQPDNQLMVDGQYVEPNHKLSIIKGFRYDDDNIIAIYYHQNLQAEGWKQEDLVGVIKAALYAYASSTNEELHFKNFDSGMDTESLKIARKFQWYYTEAYLKDINDIDL